MKVTLDKNAKLPFRAHPFDGGADLCALEGGVVQPWGGCRDFDTGVHVAIPESCVGIVKGRSGLAFNNRVICHEGTIDYGYTGTIRVLLINLGEEPYVVKPGDRIAQLLIQPVVLCPFEQVQKLEKNRPRRRRLRKHGGVIWQNSNPVMASARTKCRCFTCGGQ